MHCMGTKWNAAVIQVMGAWDSADRLDKKIFQKLRRLLIDRIWVWVKPASREGCQFMKDLKKNSLTDPKEIVIEAYS